MNTDENTTGPMEERRICWFCEQAAQAQCKCGRDYCREHTFGGRCLVCALGMGLFDQEGQSESVSDLIMLGLSAAARDPYIVIPPRLMGVQPLPMPGVERVLGAIVRMTGSKDPAVRHRSSVALAKTTNSWPTMDPSQISNRNYATGLLSVNAVRGALFDVLKQSRMTVGEPTSVAIWEKLRMADFRDLYPGIMEGLPNQKFANIGTRVHEMFAGLDEVYPTNSYAINEQCELFVYDQYVNKQRGAGTLMERMYGPKLRYAPLMARMLKKGVWHSSYARFSEWYPGEDEPY
jgi:hypothetical protein